jgi:glucokinase
MTATSNAPLFLGIDVGGTNVKIGLVSDSGKVLSSTSFPTNSERGPAYAIQESRKSLDQLLVQNNLASDRVVGAGLGTPGPMDLARGMILEPVNLPAWKNFPIRDQLSDALNLPVTFTNDANAAAFGEYWLGSAQELTSLVYFTLGTGVGGGIIVEDNCIEGVHSLGAELGHVCVDWSPSARRCGCGKTGHLEAYASATAVVARMQERLRTPTSSSLHSDSLTAKKISEAAEQGDTLAQDIIEETAVYLARGIAVVAHTIDPEAILLGGAMTFGGQTSTIGRRFLQTIKTHVDNLVFPEITQSLKIGYAVLGSDAGFIGAAGLARLHYHRFHPRA